MSLRVFRKLQFAPCTLLLVGSIRLRRQECIISAAIFDVLFVASSKSSTVAI